MVWRRVIPVLLLMNSGLYKTVKFKDPQYIGDPINTVKIFNEKSVDELIILDILASEENRAPQLELLEQIASEAFMPVCYGGGIKSVNDIRTILGLGFEKVAINSQALKNKALISQASEMFGTQSIVVSIDVKKSFWGKYEVAAGRGSCNTKQEVVKFAVEMEKAGAGEILLNSVDRDGTMKGYDLDLLKMVSEALSIPVIACGGAGTTKDFANAIYEGKVSAVAAGSMFVYYGKHKAVLINVPPEEELIALGVRDSEGV